LITLQNKKRINALVFNFIMNVLVLIRILKLGRLKWG
jgi:hypothetical protein